MQAEHAEFLVGTSGWTYDDWRGLFYPADLPKNKWLAYYATRFRVVEVNATFYRGFKDQTYLKWRDQVPPDFGYVLKAPRTITHKKYLEDVEEEILDFYRSATMLEDKLEMILLQLAPGTPYDLKRLRKALLAFGDPTRVAVEFRNKRWLTGETENLLRELGVAYCNADSPQSRLTGKVTSERAYLRLHGRQRWYRYDYRHAELEEIAGVALDMAARGARRIYIFFNNDYEGNAPKNATALRSMLEGR